ncbi:MAG: FAD-dependent oxidoreductase, partial [Cyanobacteria bacterium]|nr:FAD-dependent oxidoreductase [Cyanobacteriota bacterium]
MSDGRIIILGGGFAGVKCAQTLRKVLPKDAKIVVFNKENHMVFSPLLAEVASAAIKTKDVAAPLRQLLSGVNCRTEEVLNIDLEEKFIEYESYDLTRKRMDYEHLVIACGNTSNLAIVPGMDEHAFPLKSVGDALRLQSHIIDQMEKAEVCEDQSKKAWFLTFTVIGGGFSGVEVAGEINDFVRSSARFFQTIDPSLIRVNLVHSHARILPEVSPSLSEFARVKMEKRGIKFYLERKACKVTREGVWLDDENFLCGGTLVCTIGTTPLPLVARLPIEKMNGRITTMPDMSIARCSNAWAIGDCAAIPNAATGTIAPPVGQFAERQGLQVAHNIRNVLNGEQTKPFSHKTQGQLCAIGGLSAVAEIANWRISGFPAWFLWRTIYLMKLPSLSQRIKVAIEWSCELIFPRDLAYVKTDSSRSATREFYAPGDYVFRQGDPANFFYVIERGEVDILTFNEDKKSDEVVAVLGPGDFFGEAALVASRPRNASVRARDNLLVVGMGKGLFSEMSANLAPLRDAIANAVKRRRNIWKDIPEVQS